MKKELVLLTHLKKIYKEEDQMKYGLIKVVNFIIILLMYSTCNEGKSVVADRFIRTLKKKNKEKRKNLNT